MKPICFAALICQIALLGQVPNGASAFQQAGSLGVGFGDRGRGIELFPPVPRVEKGKPFSATVTTQTLQTLEDGTHLSHATKMAEYRDADGRVRTEPLGAPSSDHAKMVTIDDPVALVSYILYPARKLALKTPFADTTIASPGSGRGAGSSEATRNAQVDIHDKVYMIKDLPTSTINGVPARGSRISTRVPIGAIGNDREFQSVSELWFSSDLNLLIKSVNTDPRFGTTIYELTNISRQPPDPSLFRVPSEYNVASNLVEGIEFQGLTRVPQDVMRMKIVTKAGDAYDEDALHRDFLTLWETRRFDDIQMKTESGARGGIIVVFVVTERR